MMSLVPQSTPIANPAYNGPSEWAAMDKLLAFQKLPVGWRYGSGGPISKEVTERAFKTYKFFREVGFRRTNFFAGEGGDVLATAYLLQCYVGVDVETDGHYSVIFEKLDEEQFFRNALTEHQMRGAVLEAVRSIWNISDSFIRTTSTTIVANSTIWRSSPRPMGVDFQFSRLLAPAA